LIESLNFDNFEKIVLKLLIEQYPEMLQSLIGKHGAAIINIHSKKKIKDIFNTKPKKQSSGEVIVMSDGSQINTRSNF
jgi:hypothetical protein